MSGRRKATIAFFTGSVLQSLVVAVQSLVLIPLSLRLIGQRLYGAWAGSNELLFWIQSSDLGIPNLMVQRIGAAHGKGDQKAVGEWLASGLFVFALLCLILMGLGALLAPFIPSWYPLEPKAARELQLTFLIGTVATAAGLFTNAIGSYARGVQRTGAISVAYFLGALAGFLVAWFFLLQGKGLLALAYGLSARTLVLWVLCGILLVQSLPPEIRKHIRIRKQVVREMAVLAPVTALAGLAYAFMNQSELLIISLILTPELAAQYLVLRKAVELPRSISDVVSFATYGSFAHLVASEERRHALEVYRQITAVRASLSVALAAAYIAVNPSFVVVWAQLHRADAALLSVLIGLQSVLAGTAFLKNYLLRAAGEVMKGSYGLILESLARIGLALAMLPALGVAAIPLAAMVTSIVAAFWAERSLMKNLGETVSGATWVGKVEVLQVGLLGGAALLAYFVYHSSWTYVIGQGLLVSLICVGLFLLIDKRTCAALNLSAKLQALRK